jgi:hypothetical protein
MPLDPSQGYPMPPIGIVETMGDAGTQADDLIEALDATMRSAYDTHIARVGRNIYPMIYVDFTLVGGRYTLVEDESRTHVRAPDLQGYAELKSIAHVPLGIFVQIAEYAKYPGNGQWIPAVQSYRNQLQAALEQIDHTQLNGFEKTACRKILTGSIQFIDSIVSRKTFTLDDFRAYTRGIVDSILFCSQRAAVRQVTAMTNVVLEFKQILGARWDDVYVVIAALWTLSQENVHALVIGKQMTEEKKETNLLVSEAVPTLDAAKVLLGRVVGDRIAAQYVFLQGASRAENEDIYSLSTKRDLLSQAAEQALGMTREELSRACPHAPQAQTNGQA